MIPKRPQPPSISTGPGEDVKIDLPEPGVEVDDAVNDENWLKKARDAYQYSTSFADSNYRKVWEDSIRAFNNQHANDSKYGNPNYDKRSKIYRPKTRTIIRKNEAAAAAAFFSNMDVVSLDALNQGDPKQRVSAEIMKPILEYRLNKSIPWFLTVQGGLQDAQTQGAVCAHVYWMYDEKNGIDKPCVDLIPIENFRVDPGASWIDPVNTSPYIIHLIPMYVGDVRVRMQTKDKNGKTWNQYPDAMIRAAMQQNGDTTRMSRNANREDPYDPDGRPVSDYEIVWIQRHIHRFKGQDYEFFMLGELAMLSDPVPLKDVVFHGMRPYVMGCAVIETHKIMPTSVPMLMQGLQAEANEIANQRLDNIKFVLNKRWIVKRGKNVDLSSLVRNVPGGITMADDPDTDVKESTWPDVTASAYQEQQQIDADTNELIGNFSPVNMPNRKAGETVRGMTMLAQPANSLTEYLLRTYVETFVEPVLRHLVKLEQYYETDQTVFAIAAEKAKLLQRYNVDKVTDDLLNQDLTIKVNVGMGATDPATKLAKITQGITAFTQIAKTAPPYLNMGEVGKEIFGAMGYQDGARFFKTDDPEKARLQTQVQQLTMMLQQQGKMLKDKQMTNVVSLEKAKIAAKTQLAKTAMVHEHENRQMVAQAFIDRVMPQENQDARSERPAG